MDSRPEFRGWYGEENATCEIASVGAHDDESGGEDWEREEGCKDALSHEKSFCPHADEVESIDLLGGTLHAEFGCD